MIIRLAGNHVAVGFGAHAVERGGAAFDSEVAGGGVELAVLGRRVPDEFLSARGGLLRCHVEDGLQLVFVQSRADGQTLSRIDEGIQPDGRDARVREKIQRGGDGFDIRPQHGGVGHHVEFGGEDVLQACDGLLERAVGAHHLIVDFWHAGFDGDLHMVKPRVHKLLDVVHVRKAAGVGVQSRDLSVGFGVANQFGQVIPQGGFAACEDDVRHAQFPEFVENVFPVIRFQFGIIPLAGVVAVGAVVVTAVGDCQVHAVGRGRARTERHGGIEFQFVDGTGAVKQGFESEG